MTCVSILVISNLILIIFILAHKLRDVINNPRVYELATIALKIHISLIIIKRYSSYLLVSPVLGSYRIFGQRISLFSTF